MKKSILFVLCAFSASLSIASSPRATKGPKDPSIYQELHCKVVITHRDGSPGNYPQRIYQVDLNKQSPMLTSNMKAGEPIELEDGSTVSIFAQTGAYGALLGNEGGLLVTMQNGGLTGEAEVAADGKNYGYPFGTRDFVESATFGVNIGCTP